MPLDDLAACRLSDYAAAEKLSAVEMGASERQWRWRTGCSKPLDMKRVELRRRLGG